MANPKIVILCLENRSFDEYFGTFPGAIGFYDPAGGEVFSQPGIMPDGSNLRPFRMSSFSTSSQWSPSMAHGWLQFAQEWNYGAMNGFSVQAGATNTQPDQTTKYPRGPCVMGYYAGNDIAYHWSLAQAFLLCDTYFCSQMGATAPNRMMLMSGTAIDPQLFAQQPPPWLITDTLAANDPMLQNPQLPIPDRYPWQSYFGIIGNGYDDHGGWAIFDEQGWEPPWLAWTPGLDNPNPAQQPVPYYQGWPGPYFVNGPPGPSGLNMLEYLTDNAQQPPGPGLAGGPPGFYYSSQGSQPLSSFEMQARNGLPGISFIVPPTFLTEHPAFAPSDGESYLARIVYSVVTGPDWSDPGVVLIITYDEHDGHFDHVPPPTPTMSGQQAPPIAPPITPGTALTWQPTGPPATGSWEPWVNVQDSSPPSITPLGASGRVPTIIVSPWTFKAGLSSQVAPEAKFDHSSVIQYLEELTGVPCANLPDQPPLNWRRETFSSLTTLIPAGNQPASRAEVLGQLPSYEQVDGWRTDLLTRLFGPNPAYPPTFLNTDGSWQGPPVILPNPAPDPVQTWPPLRQTCDAVADKATFGLDDVRVAAAAGGDPGGTAPFPSALWVILDGFDAAELNLGTLAQKTGYPPLTPAVKLSVASGAAPKGISWTVGPAEATESMPENVPQRFRFPVDITFTTDDQGNYPAFSGVTPESPASITVQVSFTSHLTWNAPALELELVVTDGPFIQTGAVPYLSTDLRAYAVYTDGRGPDLFGVPYRRSQAPTSYVQQVIAALNSSPAQQAAFAAAQPDDDQAAVSTVTSLPDLDGRPVANFAIARITMQGPSQSAYNVRVFFRLFPALSKTSTAFNPATLYRSTPLTTPAAPDPSGSQPDTVTSPNPNAPKSEFQPGYPWLTRVPLLGLDGPNAPGTEVVTLPFFAVERVTPDQAMYEQPPDWPNTQTINIPSGTTGPVYAFFGCWLDINQPDVPQFPASVPADGQADGPFTASVRPASSITSLIRSQHLCLVAEIAYDEITIPPGVTPGTSDRLAQRNLSVIGGES